MQRAKSPLCMWEPVSDNKLNKEQKGMHGTKLRIFNNPQLRIIKESQGNYTARTHDALSSPTVPHFVCKIKNFPVITL